MPKYRDSIRDGRDQFGVPLEVYAAKVLSAYAKYYHRSDNKPHDIPPLNQVAKGADLVAFVLHDRWLVRCPDCGDVQFVWLDKPLFMCAGCFNEEHGHKWRRVVLPDEKTRKAIEDVLGHRLKVRDRNWEPSESVADLKRQNADAGESVPGRKG